MSAPAEILRAMADRIERNAEDEFAGCFVLIPPQALDDRNGETLAFLLIEPHRDPANFWTLCGNKLDDAVRRFKATYDTPPLGGYHR